MCKEEFGCDYVWIRYGQWLENVKVWKCTVLKWKPKTYDFMTYLTNKPRIIITIYGSIDWINFVELLDDILKHTLFLAELLLFHEKKNITIYPNLSFKIEKICNICRKIQQQWIGIALVIRIQEMYCTTEKNVPTQI